MSDVHGDNVLASSYRLLCFKSGSHALKNDVKNDQKFNKKKRKHNCFSPNPYIQNKNKYGFRQEQQDLKK
eukprot:1943782-Ditylum_brightwellii.AAC.1